VVLGSLQDRSKKSDLEQCFQTCSWKHPSTTDFQTCPNQTHLDQFISSEDATRPELNVYIKGDYGCKGMEHFWQFSRKCLELNKNVQDFWETL